MNLRQRLSEMERNAPSPAADGEFIMIIRWEEPQPRYYRIDADGERQPCTLDDIPNGDEYFTGAPIVASWNP